MNDYYIGGYTQFSCKIIDNLSYDRQSKFEKFTDNFIVLFKVVDGKIIVLSVETTQKKENKQVIKDIKNSFERIDGFKSESDIKESKISVNYYLNADSCGQSMICVHGFSDYEMEKIKDSTTIVIDKQHD